VKLKIKSTSKSFLAMIIIAFTILGCQFGETRSSLPVEPSAYSFDTKTILESIARGKDDTFTPLDASSETLEETFQSESADWKQADYLVVADALHKVVWGESLSSWKIHSMIFRLSCSELQQGYLDSQFVFYKILDSDNDKSRIVHNLVINPTIGEAYIQAEKYTHLVMGWEVIDLEENHVTADDALLIAETNGGREIRKSVDNECNISVSFSPVSGSFDGWKIRYYQNPGTLFELKVDPANGEYE